ncbi:MAG: hypothetical protein HY959_11855 [Ignavibacteriae bacterium]|nr:hypothetical protein [Ignavibacteriota bacterium]
MKKIFLLVLFLLPQVIYSASGDTVIVQTFTFKDLFKRRGIFQFPNQNERWSKIIMVRTLKCDWDTKHDKYPCGEWDYTTNTLVYVPRFAGDTVKEIFELENFVTPYGKRLDLNGEKGWSYFYDVTDYAPLLKGDVDLSSGNLQELLDMKFIFIKGVPARDVIAIENIYPWGMYKYYDLADNKKLPDKNLVLRKDAKGYKLKARITGHREVGPYACCEWDSKQMKYTYGNSEGRMTIAYWTVWKDCSRNPVYPQGGTWPFDRAGWCPGSPAQTFEFDISNLFNPGDTIQNFDYEIQPYSGNGEKDGEFVESHQIVYYGPPNFSNDASVDDIIAPNNYEGYRRDNPVCGSPIIIIKNNGSNILQTAIIIYGLSDRKKSEYKWSGYLKFLETQEVYLPMPDWGGISEGSTFTAEILSPNNMNDENASNNLFTSEVSVPAELPNKFILHIEANDLGRAKENAYFIFDGQGKIFFERKEFEDNAIYSDEINLTGGCYLLLITDKQRDGMMKHWWERAHPERIGKNGRIFLTNTSGDTLRKFPYDFGAELRFCFSVR